MSELQLQMNFAKRENRFKSILDRGEFALLIEQCSPGKDNDPAASSERLAALEEAVLGIKDIHCSLAITDRYGNLNAWRAVEYASALSPENRDRHVIYVSGFDSTRGEIEDLGKIAETSGLVNLVAVSGNAVPGESARDTRKRHFTESLETVKLFQSHFYTGVAVNPFQYTPFNLFGQYFKLTKKLESGANFIVTQTGWDMLKLQSLRWYLTKCNLIYPMIARLVILTPERVERILANLVPGVNISPDFRKILEKELRYSTNQFEAAQYRRLELQAAGCRFLGYSGVQLMGAELPHRAKIAAERIAGALKEFTSFEHWLEEYNSYLARTEMAPFSDSFYLYDRTLNRPFPEDDTTVRANELGKVEISKFESLKYNLRKFFLANSNKQRASGGRILKKVLCSCKSCRKCRLTDTFYICVENCPKKLANGPCGGVKPNGNCEVAPNTECLHVKIVRLAAHHNELTKFENTIISQEK